MHNTESSGANAPARQTASTLNQETSLTDIPDEEHKRMKYIQHTTLGHTDKSYKMSTSAFLSLGQHQQPANEQSKLLRTHVVEM
jgi:hypothetical protein